MDAVAELGRNPASKHQIQRKYEYEQADVGRDCRTRLARPNSQARTGTGKYQFPSPADHEQDDNLHPVDPYSCHMCDHAYPIALPSTHSCYCCLFFHETKNNFLSIVVDTVVVVLGLFLDGEKRYGGACSTT